MILTLANRKGGTGKTTTVVNLAALWGSQGQRVLVIDLDSQGHAAIGLGLTYEPAANATIHHLLRHPDTPVNALWQATACEGVSLIPADTRFSGHGEQWPLTGLQRALAKGDILHYFDVVIIDTPPTQDGLLISAMCAASAVLVPFVPHHLGEVGAKQLARLFYRVATEQNPSLGMLGLLPVMFDARLQLHRQTVDRLARQFGQARMLAGVRNNIKLAEAFAHGLPIHCYAPRSAGAQDYRALIQSLGAKNSH
ncbi:ParA family protein [Vreelandella massiliensis]|uniref:ParA family protein n=1 Tax=Vreelandella massiliensis TaxID=1816686 RepID=UPI0019267424|nr:ParA family protein [Halomonas massiliensis]